MTTDPNQRPMPSQDAAEDGGIPQAEDEEAYFGEPGSLSNRPEAEPDAPPVDGLLPDQRSDRLVTEDEGAHTVTSPDFLASDLGGAGGAGGSEEAAMHVADADVRDTRERDADAAAGLSQDPSRRP